GVVDLDNSSAHWRGKTDGHLHRLDFCELIARLERGFRGLNRGEGNVAIVLLHEIRDADSNPAGSLRLDPDNPYSVRRIQAICGYQEGELVNGGAEKVRHGSFFLIDTTLLLFYSHTCIPVC